MPYPCCLERASTKTKRGSSLYSGDAVRRCTVHKQDVVSRVKGLVPFDTKPTPPAPNTAYESAYKSAPLGSSRGAGHGSQHALGGHDKGAEKVSRANSKNICAGFKPR